MAIAWFCVHCLKDIDGQRDYFGQELCQECGGQNGTRAPSNEMEDRTPSTGTTGMDTGAQGTMVSDEMSALLQIPDDSNIA